MGASFLISTKSSTFFAKFPGTSPKRGAGQALRPCWLCGSVTVKVMILPS